MKEQAFTLAEVLITLGIIGIVAAMTLPAILAKTEKQETIAKLKKTYSIMTQGIKQSELENGELSTWPEGDNIVVEDYYNKYWKPYYKNPKICPTAKDCGYASNRGWTNLNGDAFSWSVVSDESRVLFMLADGTLIFYPRNTTVANPDGSVSNVYVNYFFVDINGPKNPNIIGRDVFIFTISDKNSVRPWCYDKNVNYINNHCTRNTGGTLNCCTAKIIADGWEIKNDYPW